MTYKGVRYFTRIPIIRNLFLITSHIVYYEIVAIWYNKYLIIPPG